MLSSNMLLLILILLIDVTFPTPTGVYTQVPRLTHLPSSPADRVERALANRS